MRAHTRVRTVEALWREAFATADVMSEGAPKDEAHPQGARVWYGSTSLILSVAGDEKERAFAAAVAERDLHVRTRALRIAVREAASRASFAPCQGARLGRSQCEIRIAVDPRGVRIDVDVQAPLIERSSARGSARR